MEFSDIWYQLKRDFRTAYDQAAPPRRQRMQRHRPTERDLNDWIDIASKREPPRKRDKQTLRRYLQRRSPRHWIALQRELRWAEKELLKLGMNPEDTRWIV